MVAIHWWLGRVRLASLVAVRDVVAGEVVVRVRRGRSVMVLQCNL